jgi:hypothetical protein
MTISWAIQIKKRAPILLFFATFVFIVIIIFAANQRSPLVGEFHLPFNEGIRGLPTYKNSLMSVSSDSEVFVWDWNELSKEPRTGSAKSNQAICSVVEPP